MSSGRGAGMDPTLGDVSAKKKRQNSAEAEPAREFLRLASDRGLSLTGPDGLLKQFTKLERFHGTFRPEISEQGPFTSLEAAQAAVDAWVEHYNSERPHQGLDEKV